MDTACAKCGRPVKRRSAKYCSQECAGNAPALATRECDHCGKVYSRSPAHLRKHCSVECKFAGQRKAVTGRRRYRVAPGHPIAPPSGLLPEARAVLFDKIGPDPTNCHWCGNPIRWYVGVRGHLRDGIAADHVNSDWHNDHPDNIVAACGPCNANRARAIQDGEPAVVRANGEKLRTKRAACIGCGRDFNATYGRECSTCRTRRRREAAAASA